MTPEEKYRTLKIIFWDYRTDLLPLDKVINRELDSIGDYEFNMMLNRMLERLSWYDLLEILGPDAIKRLLTKVTISKIRFNELRERYELIRKILSGEVVSFTGWGDEYYNKIKHTLFSHRWYSTKQALL